MRVTAMPVQVAAAGPRRPAVPGGWGHPGRPSGGFGPRFALPERWGQRAPRLFYTDTATPREYTAPYRVLGALTPCPLPAPPAMTAHLTRATLGLQFGTGVTRPAGQPAALPPCDALVGTDHRPSRVLAGT